MVLLFKCVTIALVIFGLLVVSRAHAEDDANPKTGIGYIDHYVSVLDGQERPYAVCVTDTSDTPKPLVIDVSPGGSLLDNAKDLVTGIVAVAFSENKSCVALRPTGRGIGSVYQNYGERDLFEAIEDVCQKHAIDRDRISVFGHSMGGAATWYLASHYPDFFSAASPSAGYCDYRLWKKPGGWTFTMHPWEEPSWIARSAVFLPENFRQTPVWIFHGQWDRGVGGGVDIRHALQMRDRLTELGYDVKYTEGAGQGHSYAWEGGDIPLFKERLMWLLAQRKECAPKHVTFGTYELRHNQSYWVTIDQLEQYGGMRGFVDATLEDGKLVVKTKNVRTLSLGPLDVKTEVVLDGRSVGEVDLSKVATFRKGRRWTISTVDATDEKHHGASGGFEDIFFEDTILVQGTNGTDEENFFLKMMPNEAVGFYQKRNGGVHRGGIMGDNQVELAVVSDAEITDEQLSDKNLLCFGTFDTNLVLAKFRERIPLEFGTDTITLRGKTYKGDDIALLAVFPHPDNPQRYIAVHGGTSPDAITWGSHIDLGLLPDYLVYAQDNVIDWGYWDSEWKTQKD